MNVDDLSPAESPQLTAALDEAAKGPGYSPGRVEREVGRPLGAGLRPNRSFHDRDPDATVAAVRDWLDWATGSHSPNAAFTDTTHVTTVHELLFGETYPYDQSHPYDSLDLHSLVTGTTLLDLASFARAVVLYDHILVLDGARSQAEELNAGLDEPVLLPLLVEPGEYGERLDGVGAFLAYLYNSADSELTATPLSHGVPVSIWRRTDSPFSMDREAIAAAWSIILGHEIDPASVFDHQTEDRRWRTDGAILLGRLVGTEQFGPSGMHVTLVISDDNRERLYNMVSECNLRSYFNLRLADILDLPYIGSVTRVPFRSQLYRTAAFAHHRILLHEEIEKRVSAARYVVPDRPTLALPVFASIALRRAQDQHGILTELAELRRRSAALRRRRAEYETLLHDPTDDRELVRLRAALDADAGNLTRLLAGPVALSAAAVLAAASGPTTGLAVGAMGLLTLAGSLQREERTRIIRRLLRPAEWFLTSTASTAKAIASSRSDVQRIWRINDARTDWIAQRLVQLQQLGPG